MRIQLSNGLLHFYQWDTGQKVKAPDGVETIHFRIDNDHAAPVTVVNGWATVPDECFQSGDDLVYYAYDENHTTDSARVEVKHRPKPVDYGYEPMQITTWEALDKRIRALEVATGLRTEKTVIATATAGTPLIIDSQAAEQTVNLAWNVPEAKTIPAFANYYVAKNGISYPRAFDTNGYTQTWDAANYHGNADAFVSGHKYFCAMEYEMDGDSTAQIQSWGGSVTPSGTDVISGSGWVYGVAAPVHVNAANFVLKNTSSGTGTIKHVYCIDVTALLDAGTISSVAINDLVALFGGLDLVPGQDFAGGTTGGTATLTIARGDTQQLVDSPASTATIKGGDVLSVSAGTVSFVYVTTEITSSGTAAGKQWADKKWCAFGLTRLSMQQQNTMQSSRIKPA